MKSGISFFYCKCYLPQKHCTKSFTERPGERTAWPSWDPHSAFLLAKFIISRGREGTLTRFRGPLPQAGVQVGPQFQARAQMLQQQTPLPGTWWCSMVQVGREACVCLVMTMHLGLGAFLAIRIFRLLSCFVLTANCFGNS